MLINKNKVVVNLYGFCPLIVPSLHILCVCSDAHALCIHMYIQGLRSGAIPSIAPDAIAMDGWDWKLKKVIFNLNH